MKNSFLLTLLFLISCGKAPIKNSYHITEYNTHYGIEVVELCPELEGDYPEVLFRIEDKLYANYDGGKDKDRLVEVVPGPDTGYYKTTDGRECFFKVTEDYEIEYEF